MIYNNIETKMKVPISSDVRFYTISDVKELTGWSEKTVQALFNSKEFPAASIGRAKLIEAHALIEYFSRRRDKSEIA